MSTVSEIYKIGIDELMKVTGERGFNVNRKEAMHFCSPSGGGWGVVRVACIVPEVEVLFAIPIGCGRHGSIASFANKTSDKLSFFIIEEVDIVMGSHLKKIEEAIEELFNERNPKGIIVCTTCMDDLLGSDYDGILSHLEEKLQIPVKRGKMNPILSGTTKDPTFMIQKTVYDFLENKDKAEDQLNVIGSFSNIDDMSEIHVLMKKAGIKPLCHISNYKSFDEYKSNMEKSSANLLVGIVGKVAGKYLEKKLGQKCLEVYSCYRSEEIENNYKTIEKHIGKKLEYEIYKKALEEKIENSKEKLKGITVAIGTNGITRPFELARFLSEMGMKVSYVIAKAIPEFEKPHVEWLEMNSKDTIILPNLEPSLCLYEEKIDDVDLCFGLDAAVLFNRNYVIELDNDMNNFGYNSSIQLIDKILEREFFQKDLYKAIYDANLVI